MQSGRQKGRKKGSSGDHWGWGVELQGVLLTRTATCVSVSSVSLRGGGGRSRLAGGDVGRAFKARGPSLVSARARGATHCFGSGGYGGTKLLFTRRNLSRFHYFSRGKGFSVAPL